ncbi:MAG: glycosyltransferase family 2 protein [Acidocella sp.]|uniref:glycosyltransferase family 2 protein n=1 Tax=Acidocella sp. TaxID=50710 RepID=UPI003FC58932
MHFSPKGLARAPTKTGAVTSVRIAVIVASIRRGEEIGQLLEHLATQTLAPSSIVLSVEVPSDLPAQIPVGVDVIMGPKGLTRQRNRGLEHTLPVSDIVVFFDDDFVPANDALAGIAKLFQEHPDIVGATGLVLRDGVKQGGIAYQDAIDALRQHERDAEPKRTETAPTSELYGCNMAFRTRAIGAYRFDETLPLYGWQEDVDFTGQLMKFGLMVRTNAFAGVHRGVNKGRTSGVALGYSQMVNPVYLVRKGTMRPAQALRLMVRNFFANHAGVIRPEPFIDRAGRCKGNWIGLLDLLRLRCNPERILALI